MSTSGDGQSNSPEALRAERDATREQMGDTVEALAAKTDVKARAEDRVGGIKQDARAKADQIREKVTSVTPESARQSGGELAASDIWDSFKAEYVDREVPLELDGYRIASGDGGERIEAVIRHAGKEHEAGADGNGPLDAFVRAIHAATGIEARVLDYEEHALGSGSDARAAAYVQVEIGEQTSWGVAVLGLMAGTVEEAATATQIPFSARPGNRVTRFIVKEPAPNRQSATAKWKVASGDVKKVF